MLVVLSNNDFERHYVSFSCFIVIKRQFYSHIFYIIWYKNYKHLYMINKYSAFF